MWGGMGGKGWNGDGGKSKGKGSWDGGWDAGSDGGWDAAWGGKGGKDSWAGGGGGKGKDSWGGGKGKDSWGGGGGGKGYGKWSGDGGSGGGWSPYGGGKGMMDWMKGMMKGMGKGKDGLLSFKNDIKVFIGGLPQTPAPDKDLNKRLKEHMSQGGAAFKTQEEVQKAVALLNGSNFEGNVLVVAPWGQKAA
eukprot:TRINITY_DN3869_c0_g2_i1.p1 TRINITY_DN3869_c0_g2~~TRINITY_DN3869_c0_g2_i1.p1  ORF type:complete len:191 (+),score=68.52 TRINITY_DN3869_c0_g2_i1:62-634(+)